MPDKTWIDAITDAPKKTDVYIVGNDKTKGVWIASYNHHKRKWYDTDSGAEFYIFDITHYQPFPEIK